MDSFACVTQQLIALEQNAKQEPKGGGTEPAFPLAP